MDGPRPRRPGLPQWRGIASVRDGLRIRWVGLAAASWVGSCAGLSYMFSLYSQSLRSHLGFSQTQVDLVGMAKDLGGSIGIVSGLLGDLVPPWIVLAIGGLQSLLGFGGLWLVLQHSVGPNAASLAPLWLVMLLIGLGTNSATFYNTGEAPGYVEAALQLKIGISNLCSKPGCTEDVLGTDEWQIKHQLAKEQHLNDDLEESSNLQPVFLSRNAGGMVTCVKNFPHSRGPVVGLLKVRLPLAEHRLNQGYTRAFIQGCYVGV